jgi:dienelactone hydrolase
VKFLSIIAGIFIFSLPAQAKIDVKKVEYKDGETVLEGLLVTHKKHLRAKKKHPAVLVVHNWMGPGESTLARAKQLAEMGYVAFVADIYGQGVRPQNVKEASAQAGRYRSNERKEMRSRAQAAFDTVSKNVSVDPNRISAIGYCFGGMVVLEMARMGLPLTGVVGFHGGLSSVSAEDAKNIKSQVLILHGAIDPYVPMEEVNQFQKEMNAANVNYEFVAYSGAVHAFSEKEAGDDMKTGAAYNEQADRRSFIAMTNFLKEVNK